MDPSRPETPAEAEARRIREEAARRRPPDDPDHPGQRARSVSAALRSLPPGWSRVGAVPREGAREGASDDAGDDHGGTGEDRGQVLVGPGGVAVVRAFTPTGPLRVEAGVLLEDGRPAAAAAAAATAASRLRELGGPAARRTTAVLCVPTAIPVLRGDGVLVCSVGDLVRVLTETPAVLAPGEAAGAAIRLAAALRRGPGAVAGPGTGGRLPVVVAVVVAVLLLAALLLVAPRLGDGLGGLVGGCPDGSASC